MIGRRDGDDDRDGRRGWARGDEWRDGSEDDPVVAATALLVLGLGLGSLFGFVPIDPFWAVFVVGFAVVVPLVKLVRDRRRASGEGDRRRQSEENAAADDEGEFDDALARLRDRYARGELTEEQFERKLELLLETETPEDARERLRRRDRAREAARDTDTES
jgi:uncharacterized membrane protein